MSKKRRKKKTKEKETGHFLHGYRVLEESPPKAAMELKRILSSKTKSFFRAEDGQASPKMSSPTKQHFKSVSRKYMIMFECLHV